MKRTAAFLSYLLLVFLVGLPAYSQEIPVRIKGFDDGIRTDRQKDYKEAVLFAKREAIERAGVKIRSKSAAKDFILTEDYIEAQSEAVLLPGYEIVDLGYSESGVYQVVLIGTIRMDQGDGSHAVTAAKDPVPEGLVLHYGFEQNAARDLSGKGRDGRLKGNPRFVSGPVGLALALDGIDDYVVIGALEADFSKGLSVSAWVKVDENTLWGRVMDLSNGPWKENIVLGHLWDKPNLMFECMGDAGYHPLLWYAGKNSVDQALSPGRFRHVVISCTTSGNLYKVEVWVDGEKAAATDALGRPNEWTTVPASVKRTQNYLGKSPFKDDRLLMGALDEFRLYNRPLAATEVYALYRQGRP